MPVLAPPSPCSNKALLCLGQQQCQRLCGTFLCGCVHAAAAPTRSAEAPSRVLQRTRGSQGLACTLLSEVVRSSVFGCCPLPHPTLPNQWRRAGAVVVAGVLHGWWVHAADV